MEVGNNWEHLDTYMNTYMEFSRIFIIVHIYIFIQYLYNIYTSFISFKTFGIFLIMDLTYMRQFLLNLKNPRYFVVLDNRSNSGLSV